MKKLFAILLIAAGAFAQPVPPSTVTLTVDKTTGAISAPVNAATFAAANGLLTSAATQAANTVYAGPPSGGVATPAFRALVAADIPNLAGIYQPLDSDLTSIAALTTTTFGRGLLTEASASTARSTLGVAIGTNVQAWDADLDSIAALTTTAFGRGLLTEASATSLRTTLGVLSSAEVAAAYQPLDADLTSIAALTTTANGRSLLTASALTSAGLGLTNGAAIDALSAVSTAGVLVRTGANTYTARTITGTPGNVTVTNGDGVGGVPTLSLPPALTSINSITAASATDLTLNAGSSGVAAVLGQGASGVATITTPVTATGISLTVNGPTARATVGTDQFAAWVRPINNGVSHIQSVGWSIGRYSAVDTSARTQLDLGLADGSGGTLTTVASFRGNGTFIVPTSGAGNVLIGTTTDIPGIGGLKVAGTTSSTNTTTGSLINGGGFGNAGPAWIGGLVDIAGTTTMHAQQVIQMASGSAFQTMTATSGTTDVYTQWQNTTPVQAGAGVTTGRVFLGALSNHPVDIRVNNAAVASFSGTIGGVSYSPGAGSVASWTTTGVLSNHATATITNSSTGVSGTAASAVFHSFQAPTLAATNTTVTTTDAATVYIGGGPIAGTNQTISNSWGLWNLGKTRLEGNVNVIGTASFAPSISSNNGLTQVDAGGTSSAARVRMFNGSGTVKITLDAGGASTFADTTPSTSVTTGSAIFGGGVGVSGALWALGGSTITAGGTTTALTVNSSFNGISLAVTAAGGGPATQISNTGYGTSLNIVGSTGTATSGNDLAGVFVTNTYTHTHSVNGPIGTAYYGSITNNTATGGTAYGVHLSVTANSATAAGIDVIAASSGGTAYGVRSRVASGTNQWNIYADGTAANLLSGLTTFGAGTTARASINLPHGSAPTSPVDGDLWSTTSGFFGRVNGVTVGPFGAGGGGGTGTVTNTGGVLTNNSVVLGAGTVDTKVVAGITTDGTSKLNLGVAGSSVGSVALANATSGTITLSPVTGALGSVTILVPARSDTLVTLSGTETLASKTLTSPVINGATSSGSTSVDFSGNSGTFKSTTGAVTIGPGAVGVTGITTYTPPVRSSGVASYLTVNIPADTGQTASTESIGYQHVTGTRTWATTGTVALQRENFFAGPTYASASASQTFTDAFNVYMTPPVAGTNAIFTRGHTLGIVDATSASSSITGGLVVATTLGTTATSVGIGGGNINAGGNGTFGGTLAATGHTTFEGVTSTGATGTGKLVYDTAPQLSTVELGAATDTTIARVGAGQISVENVNVVTVSSTDTLTNKTFDAAATGNVLKAKGYIYLTHPHLADGTNATIGTTPTAIGYGHGAFNPTVDSVATPTNYVEYYFQVPEDIDTSVALRARLKVVLGGADTGSQRYTLASVSVADSAVPTAATLANTINIDFAGDASGASGDVETSAWTTLTSWAGALTAGQTWRIRLSRDGDTSDTSSVASTELGLVIEYGITQ